MNKIAIQLSKYFSKKTSGTLLLENKQFVGQTLVIPMSLTNGNIHYFAERTTYSFFSKIIFVINFQLEFVGKKETLREKRGFSF